MTEELPTVESEWPTEEATPESRTYLFGETATFEDGLRVTIAKPVAFKPGEYAAGTEGFKHFVKFKITIDNQSGKTFDPTMASASVMSGDTEGSEVYDSEHNLGGSPSTKLLNGRKVTYTVAFGVTNLSDIVVEFSPSWEHEAVMYSLTGK